LTDIRVRKDAKVRLERECNASERASERAWLEVEWLEVDGKYQLEFRVGWHLLRTWYLPKASE
jgi:hypothetical protein